MFNKLKQVKELRDQAKTMQNALAEESVTIEKNGIKLTMNGNFEIIEYSIEDGLSKEKIEDITKKIFNDAIKKIQRIMAQKMQSMGGFGNFGLN